MIRIQAVSIEKRLDEKLAAAFDSNKRMRAKQVKQRQISVNI